ncbi:MAG: hypothetical protein FJ211_08495 [Ignavibacteria bacterium]|nr:hypothetical protein [Ignavibacteria bacterium]
MNIRKASILALGIITLASVQVMNAQNDGAYVGKFKSVLRSLSNYRYGDVSVFRVEGQLFTDLQRYLNPPPVDKTGSRDRISSKVGLDDAIKKAVRKTQDREKIDAFLEDEAFSPDDIASRDAQDVIQFYLDERAYLSELFSGAYVITSKYQRGETGDNLVIIGLLKTRFKPAGNTIRDLRGVNPGDVITRYELTRLDPPPTSAKSYDDKMYGFLKDQVIQNNVLNVTLEAQGIDDLDTRFVRQTFGNTVQVNEDDVQQFMKITNGIPVPYYGPNELTISAPDLISYRRYRPDPTPQTITVMEFDSTGTEVPVEKEVITYNSKLAQYGFELRSGLEDLNYPSTWSERLALNAIWSQAKLGIILPTSGLASVANAFGNQRSMTHAGFGVNTSIEVPIKLIAESGVFNVAGSYVFGDASKTKHQRYDKDATFSPNLGSDFLIRYHAQIHYTFALRVDDANLFRLRLGGAGYGIERWADRTYQAQDQTDSTEFEMYNDKFYGGVSAKVEFMNTSWSTPLGASLQYFDDAIFGNIWLHVQASNDLGFRLDVSMFSPVFREARLWENASVFMPSLRAILNF